MEAEPRWSNFPWRKSKDEEVEIDWVNYYQAVDTYLKDSFENPEQWPIYLFALPENQTMFKKLLKSLLLLRCDFCFSCAAIL